MEGIKIGIVEDELMIAENIMMTLMDLGYETTEPATNYTSALQMIEEEQPDLLLLDIILSGHKDGIELAQKVNEAYDIPFIFLTSNVDQATLDRAKQESPASYLVKPFNKNDLFAAIEVAVHAHRNKPTKEKDDKKDYLKEKEILFVKRNSLFYKIKVSDILYLKSDHVYVDIFTSKGKFTDRKSLSEYENILPDSQFIRIHRSYLVSIENIEAISATAVIVNGEELPIARKHKDALMALIK